MSEEFLFASIWFYFVSGEFQDVHYLFAYSVELVQFHIHKLCKFCAFNIADIFHIVGCHVIMSVVSVYLAAVWGFYSRPESI